MARLPPHWIQHAADWRTAPMAYWVHVEEDAGPWQTASRYRPPAPVPEGRKGYPLLCVQSGDFVFVFSSAAQLAEAIDALAMKPLPTSRRLAARRPGGHGPNSHWLSRLPTAITSPKGRLRAVADLQAIRDALSPFEPGNPGVLRVARAGAEGSGPGHRPRRGDGV